MKTLIAMLLLLPVAASCATPSKAELDAEVKRLCAIDGGIKVYETVRLPSSHFDKSGNIQLASKRYTSPADDYYYDSKDATVKQEGDPDSGGFSIWRTQFQIYRASDHKLLGEAVTYTRRGGDIPGPWHPSSFGCPAEALILEKHIFILDEGISK